MFACCAGQCAGEQGGQVPQGPHHAQGGLQALEDGVLAYPLPLMVPTLPVNMQPTMSYIINTNSY